MCTTFKLLLASFTIITAQGLAHAQLYLEAHGTFLGRIGSLTATEYDESSGELKRRPYSAGNGLGGGIVFGGELNDQLGIEARITFISGAKLTIETEFDGFSYVSKSEETWKSRSLRIEPAVRMMRGAGNAKLYVAAGPSISVGNKLTNEGTTKRTYSDPLFPTDLVRTESNNTQEYTGGIGIGGFGALGFLYQGGGALGFFVELNATAQSWAPGKMRSEYEMESYYLNGSSMIEDDTENVTFVNEYDEDDDNKDLKQHFPMSTWGLRAGLHVRLGGGE